jgi:hypothetical protein
MKQCPRCLKHTGEVGVHTCTPTTFVRDLEQKVKELTEERAQAAHYLEKLGLANAEIGTILTSTNSARPIRHCGR